MHRDIKTILIIYKADHEQVRGMAWTVADWLAARGITVLLRENIPEGPTAVVPVGTVVTGPPQLALILGGDGTMLSAARQRAADGIPFFGINLGRVGFMTSAGPDNWREVLAEILENGFIEARRIMIEVSVIRGSETVYTTTALNDAVISRGAMARLAAFKVTLGDADVCTLRADGVVVSTPTGSTAYCVSAGGPLIYPGLDVLCVVPICPFLSDFKPVVVPADSPVRLALSAPETNMYLTCDGQELFPLDDNDVVVVRKSTRSLKLAKRAKDSYFGRLRLKGFINKP
ncbi:ATP-NAD/AcoX kinase [Solidesulfovibrio carbinoliphilus subsp. oakridgensis]|uniref:NAD kinase n=1 Tax=Solidesulfovibrio carbinoliphilus subsp. oakridgensis TaxID=694327 RepID=G7QCQ0_9BACT|nr:NAD(+)/NADH kinase [Solidesulfovibrio carbinoliphilus]EHJ46206.1 ATP-NAD/AcoX kinase [Solidesulfovibrio carbinoliphilus subsp. oakridgensis]